MTVLITFFAYAVQLCALCFLPFLLFFCLWLRARKKTAFLISLLCAAVILAGAIWLAFHPICSCPEELERYMTEQRWKISCRSPGRFTAAAFRSFPSAFRWNRPPMRSFTGG